MEMSTRSGAGSTGNHKIRIRQGDRVCSTEYLTTGPWSGETYDGHLCMELDMNKCIDFEVHNDSYYDPSQVRKIKFVYKGKTKTFTYDVDGDNGWFHSGNIRGHRTCN